VLDDISTETARPIITFHHPIGDAVVVDSNARAGAVTYPRHWSQTIVDSTGMALDAVVRGAWTGIAGPTAQDIVRARVR
jgi:hypothetical protein